MKNIRNFCIIAHIDHGKSTLADRLMEVTGTVEKRELREQLLDNMELERERGITIKASAVRLDYKAKDGQNYILNLIDTPGHVDFSYEVAKSLRACEGTLLLVDAGQGVEAQTMANLYLAEELGLTIIPVMNKIDLALAEVDKVKAQIVKIIGGDGSDIIKASAKNNIGIDEILERIISDIPAPQGDTEQPLQALIFDSNFDSYKGVISYVRLMNGVIRKGIQIRMMGRGRVHEVLEVGVLKPKHLIVNELKAGEVGYITCNIRDIQDVVVGDTITENKRPCKDFLPGYKEVRHMVFCGIYPVNSKDFEELREAMGKLSLNDASFKYEVESSASLGFGFRCGFLGLLHMEIIQERLEREYGINIVITSPSVNYRITTVKGEVLEVDNPSKMPEPQKIEKVEEPYVRASIMIPTTSMGEIMELCIQKRAVYKDTIYIDADKVELIYNFPLAEIIVDFYDKLKSITRGYGSLDYDFSGFRETRLVKLDILINGEVCDTLSSLVHKEKVDFKARALSVKLRKLIPRQLVEVIIQAAVGSKIIARERVSPIGKNVTSKCYGGDITRKRKLWDKQKQGKKRMKKFAKVDIPQEAFLAAIKAD